MKRYFLLCCMLRDVPPGSFLALRLQTQTHPNITNCVFLLLIIQQCSMRKKGNIPVILRTYEGDK